VGDPSLHQAVYEFADQAALERATSGENMKRLVADFNRDWPDVTRTREVFVLAEEFAGVTHVARMERSAIWDQRLAG
jgi:hypothetical protein